MQKQLWQIANPSDESVFDIDRFDLMDFNDGCQLVPHVAADINQAQEMFVGNPLQDGFLAAYKTNPQFKESQGLLMPLADLVKRGLDTSGFQQLRENTVGQIAASMIGSRHFVQNVLASLPKEIKDAAKEVENSSQTADDAQEQSENMSNLLERMAAQADSKKSDSQSPLLEQVESKVTEFAAQAEAAQAEAAQAEGEYCQLMDSQEAQMNQILNDAAEAAQEPAEEAQSFCDAFGLASGNKNGKASIEDAKMAMKLFSRNPNLADIAKFLGWAKKMVTGEKRKKTPVGKENMVGYCPGELNPTTLATSERMAMTVGNPTQKIEAGIKLAQSTLIHQDFDGESQSGRGPMVLVRDESGSMSGDRHSLAVAIEWALLGVARKHNRAFYSIPFSGLGDFHLWEAPPVGKGDAQGLIDHLGHFYDGGTDPYPPLKLALDTIQKQDLKADILLITDENFASPSERFLEQVKQTKESIGLKIIVVQIGSIRYDNSELPFADKTVNVNNFISDKELLKKAIHEVV